MDQPRDKDGKFASTGSAGAKITGTPTGSPSLVKQRLEIMDTHMGNLNRLTASIAAHGAAPGAKAKVTSAKSFIRDIGASIGLKVTFPSAPKQKKK